MFDFQLKGTGRFDAELSILVCLEFQNGPVDSQNTNRRAGHRLPTGIGHMTDHNRRQKNPKQKNHKSKNRNSETLLNPYGLRRQDILDPTHLFEHLIVDRVVDQK